MVIVDGQISSKKPKLSPLKKLWVGRKSKKVFSTESKGAHPRLSWKVNISSTNRQVMQAQNDETGSKSRSSRDITQPVRAHSETYINKLFH